MNEHDEVASSLRQWFRTVYVTYDRYVAALITNRTYISQDTTIDSARADRLVLSELTSMLPSRRKLRVLQPR